jgi:hypothetical protein
VLYLADAILWIRRHPLISAIIFIVAAAGTIAMFIDKGAIHAAALFVTWVAAIVFLVCLIEAIRTSRRRDLTWSPRNLIAAAVVFFAIGMFPYSDPITISDIGDWALLVVIVVAIGIGVRKLANRRRVAMTRDHA